MSDSLVPVSLSSWQQYWLKSIAKVVANDAALRGAGVNSLRHAEIDGYGWRAPHLLDCKKTDFSSLTASPLSMKRKFLTHLSVLEIDLALSNLLGYKGQLPSLFFSRSGLPETLGAKALRLAEAIAYLAMATDARVAYDDRNLFLLKHDTPVGFVDGGDCLGVPVETAIEMLEMRRKVLDRPWPTAFDAVRQSLHLTEPGDPLLEMLSLLATCKWNAELYLREELAASANRVPKTAVRAFRFSSEQAQDIVSIAQMGNLGAAIEEARGILAPKRLAAPYEYYGIPQDPLQGLSPYEQLATVCTIRQDLGFTYGRI
jgi:hypothetical protein